MTDSAPKLQPISRTQPPLPVSIGILTYKRPASLVETLQSLEPAGSPSPSWRLDTVIVIDNDAEPSARAAVEQLAAGGFPHPLRYVHEPRPGLAAARNRALDEATGAILVFIDDDERAEPGWPDGLIQTMLATGAALVGGPVRTRFRREPPRWISEGGFFARAEPADGATQTWLRSGNLAIDREKVGRHSLRFDPRFSHTGGEDVAFSTQARQLGLGLRWSSAAAVTEEVGPERTRIRWIMARERNSTANWVRAELLVHRSPIRRLLIAARATARLGQGGAMLLAGLLTRRMSRVAQGLVRASRGIGSFQGLLGRIDAVYGTSSPARGG